MATLVKTVEVNIKLSPADVLTALLSFTSQDWHHLQSEIKRLQNEQNIKVGHWFNFPSPDDSLDVAFGLSDLPDLPVAPPFTPEGDREALAAAEELFSLFDDIEPELARWGATSKEIRSNNANRNKSHSNTGPHPPGPPRTTATRGSFFIRRRERAALSEGGKEQPCQKEGKSSLVVVK